MEYEKIIPKRVTIETIFGCNSHCPMCPIDQPTERKKMIMSVDLSNKIFDELSPYAQDIKMLSLYGLGEPLLDPYIFQRLRYAKDKGFQGIGISTNANLLDSEKQKKLLETEIDTVLFSIDGIKKETHENIRKGVNFEKVVENCQNIIKMRDNGEYATRFITRFVIQDSNKDELKDYLVFWGGLLNQEKRDMIITYNQHSWAGQFTSKEKILKRKIDPGIEKQPCHHFLDILYILADGTVCMCHEDELHAKYKLGNVTHNNSIDVFNSEKSKELRKIHLEGRKTELDLCKECTILYSENERKKYLKK